MLEIKEAPPLEQTERKTIWAGDPAVDMARSDLKRWAETGDIDALVIREGRTPSIITWRPLEELERDALPLAGEAGVKNHLAAAARIGLVEIEGYKLGHDLWRKVGIFQVPEAQKRALMRMKAAIPYGVTYDRWQQAEFENESDETTRGVEGEVSLLEWIGALILAESFPHGG